ncbi:MAG: phosphate-starvation-inducible PsiE family protein [Desulfobacteraceae bacterium]|nr:phosphate-starvation-inducible PsiE family protein [Desulfobacteraceae bacterium]MBC2751317.1 phosphate-starvation-inducible PsiE family protein [Desulfobacteraceae bacterium]
MKRLNRVSIPVIFDNVLNYIINILIIYIIIILVLSLGKTLYTLKILLDGEQIGLNLSHAITDILSFLVMIELFRSFIEYFKAKRIRLHSMIDPAIIFILRELIVQLYTHAELTNRTLVGFGALLLCLGVVRSLALLFSPEDGIRTQ